MRSRFKRILWGLALCVSSTSFAEDAAPGFVPTISYKGDYFTVTHGGIERKGSYLGIANLTLSADAEKLWGVSGLSFWAHFLLTHGDDPNDFVGSLHGIDNIAADPNGKLHDAWVNWSSSEEFFAVLLGIYDINTEFDAKKFGGVFINPSHGIGVDISQSGMNGPAIFPTPGLGTRFKFKADNFYLQTAFLEGTPGDPNYPRGTHLRLDDKEGVLTVYEAGIQQEGNNAPYTKVAVGGWAYSTAIPSVDGGPDERNRGFYFFAERMLFSEGSGDQGLGAYIRYGTAEKTLNQVETFYGGALHYTGAIPTRDADVLAFGVAVAENSPEYLKLVPTAEKRETNYELTYKAIVTDWFSLQFDVQRIQNPATDPTLDDATVIGLRTELSF